MKKNLLKKLFALSLAVAATAASLSAMERVTGAGTSAGAVGAAASEVAQQTQQCPICFQDVAKALFIQTGCPRPTADTAVHEFCRECLTEWMNTSGQIQCPLCRRQLPAEVLRRIDRYGWWQQMCQNYHRLPLFHRQMLSCMIANFIFTCLVQFHPLQLQRCGDIACFTFINTVKCLMMFYLYRRIFNGLMRI